jgi:NAD(P)-dependent dehydrogenase (short-subunit alcohol dehydrogenase family)
VSLPSDRVVLVTGGSAGIGRATAEAFAHDGARVAVCSRRPVTGAFWVRCDVRRRDEVQAAVSAVVAKFGELHVLVNNAGFGVYGTVENTTPEDFEDLFRTNVLGPVWMIQAALPHLRKTKGQVINVTSGLARTAIPLMAGYCMTKYALHALSQSLRIELRPSRIRVIEVAPGLTDTHFQKSAVLRGMARPAAPPNRKGWRAEKVARAILRASRRGRREVWLTADANFLAWMQRHFPRVTDWGLARWAAGFGPGSP